MAKKPRENRVPIMMSDDELTAIDDWRYANRVATRSDAVRRLVQIGLIFDENADALTEETIRITDTFHRKILETAETGTRNDPESAKQFGKLFFQMSVETVENLHNLLFQLRRVMAPRDAMKTSEPFDSARHGLLAAKAKSLAAALEQKVKLFEFRKEHGLFPEQENNESKE